MAAIVYPGADYRQLPGKSTTLLTPLTINIHTMVGTLAGTESYFRQSGRPYSHFGVGGSGAVRQWQDLRYRAASDLNGNPWCISIETEDMGPYFPSWSGSNVPHFTEAQLRSLTKLVAWLCTRFAIRRILLTSSCQRNGVSYHRLGIDPWRPAGCPKFSNAKGKVCPGDNKIADIKTKLMPALQGQSIEEEDDWMAMFKDKDDFKRAVMEALRDAAGVHMGEDGMAAAQLRARAKEGAGPAATDAVDNVMKLYAQMGDSPLHEIVRQVVAEEGSGSPSR